MRGLEKWIGNWMGHITGCTPMMMIMYWTRKYAFERKT